VFRLLVKVPLHLDSVSAGLADQRVSPAETSKGVVGKLIPAGIALDGDVFHAPIVAHRGAPATVKWRNQIVVSACYIRTYGGGGGPCHFGRVISGHDHLMQQQRKEPKNRQGQ
jgi:hypothetical protein